MLRHSKKRADKDAHERNRIVEKLKRSLTQGIKGSGKRGRFLKVDRNAVELDQPGSQASPSTTHLCVLRGAVAHQRGLSRTQAHHGDAAHLSLDPQPRQGPHRDLLRRLCLAALPAQHHACGPGATQRGSYPVRAERRSSLPHYRHQHAEAVSARFPRHRSSADALQRNRTKVPQQDPCYRNQFCKAVPKAERGAWATPARQAVRTECAPCEWLRLRL